MDIGNENAASIAPVLQQLAETDEGRSKLSQIAIRIALHGLALFPASPQKPEFNKLLNIYRGVSLAWVFCKYPKQINELKRLNTLIEIQSIFDNQEYSLYPALRNDDAAISSILDATYTAILAISERPTDVSAELARNHGMILPVAGAIRPLELDWELIEIDSSVLDHPLWNGLPNTATAKAWLKLKENLIWQDAGWEVWTDWYDSRLRGGPTHPELSPAANERIEVARVLEIEDSDWEQGPAHVNAKIKAIIEREMERDQKERPLEDDEPLRLPDAGPGPAYGARGGQLRRVPSPPREGDEDASARLLPKLLATAERLSKHGQRLGNTHPDLAFAIDEYCQELGHNFDALDIAGLFATGGALVEFHLAYIESAPESPVLAEPLEPEIKGLLGNLSRQHGAFILGTKEGAELVERADRMLQQAKLLREIEDPGSKLLDALTNDRDLVSKETRNAHKVLRDLLDKLGWDSSRTGYIAMRSVFKAGHYLLVSIYRAGTRAGVIAGSVIAISTALGDAELQFLRVAIPFVRDHAGQLLAFYKHSPEMRAFAEFVLSHLDEVERILDPRVKPEDDAP